MEDNMAIGAMAEAGEIPATDLRPVGGDIAAQLQPQMPDEPDQMVGMGQSSTPVNVPKVAVVPVATNEFRITLDGRAIGHALAPHEAPIVKSWMESVVAEGGV
jgi:hypothetical protein